LKKTVDVQTKSSIVQAIWTLAPTTQTRPGNRVGFFNACSKFMKSISIQLPGEMLMIKKLLLLLMLCIGFSLNASADMSLLPGVSFASADDITSLASAAVETPSVAIRQTALDNLPNSDGRTPSADNHKSAASFGVSCDQHQALRARIAQLDQAIESATGDKQRNRLSDQLDRLYQVELNLISESIKRVTASLEAPPTNL